jgi:hypothetical protein
MKFDAASVLDATVLFRFMSVISYDMRPLIYKQVWGPPSHPEYRHNSIREALKDFDLVRVRGTEIESLREALHRKTVKAKQLPGEKFPLDIHDWGEKGKVDHARGLKELAERVERIAQLLSDLPTTGDVTTFYSEIDGIHGFWPGTYLRDHPVPCAMLWDWIFKNPSRRLTACFRRDSERVCCSNSRFAARVWGYQDWSFVE